MAGPLVAVVNDDTDFLELMQTLLAEEGYETIIWKAGKTAHDMIRQRNPDLVILDILIGNEASGWHVLDLLRLDPRTTHIPDIVCSADARSLRERAERLRQHRCETLEKPFDLDELLAKVRAAVGSPVDTQRRDESGPG